VCPELVFSLCPEAPPLGPFPAFSSHFNTNIPQSKVPPPPRHSGHTHTIVTMIFCCSSHTNTQQHTHTTTAFGGHAQQTSPSSSIAFHPLSSPHRPSSNPPPNPPPLPHRTGGRSWAVPRSPGRCDCDACHSINQKRWVAYTTPLTDCDEQDLHRQFAHRHPRERAGQAVRQIRPHSQHHHQSQVRFLGVR